MEYTNRRESAGSVTGVGNAAIQSSHPTVFVHPPPSMLRDADDVRRFDADPAPV